MKIPDKIKEFLDPTVVHSILNDIIIICAMYQSYYRRGFMISILVFFLMYFVFPAIFMFSYTDDIEKLILKNDDEELNKILSKILVPCSIANLLVLAYFRFC